MIRRRFKYVAAIVVVLVATPVLTFIFLKTYDWNQLKPWVNERTSLALGRPFTIVGDLSLSWEAQSTTGADFYTDWRRDIPWPHFVAQDIRIGNPPILANGSLGNAATNVLPTDDMAHVDRVDFLLNPLTLLQKKITIPLLRFDAPNVNFVRNADGKNNWSIVQDNVPSKWQLDVQRLIFSKGRIHLIDSIKHADVIADIDTLGANQKYGVSWNLHGKYNGEPVSGTGKAGAVLALQQQIIPYPIMATVRIGNTSISLEGTVTKPTDFAAIDARLAMSGPSIAKLYPIFGILLPETPAFSTEGHLVGAVNRQNAHWIYESFKGTVGASDLEGTLDFRTKPLRPLLIGNVRSHLMQFDDLAPLIGADSNSSKARRGVVNMQPVNKALPVEPFKTGRWTSVDVNLKFDADTIVLKKSFQITKLSADLHLQDGVLTLSPLDFRIADGSVSSNLTLDGSGRNEKEAISAKLTVSARNLKIQQLLPSLPDKQASIGELDGDASLSAVGNSVGSLLARSNGEIKASIPKGSISKLLLEEIGLNIGSIVMTKLVGDKQVELNCMASDFAVKSGIVNTQSFIIDTDVATINASGTIDLAQEQLDMTVTPKSKGVRLFSLRAPIYVRGSFLQPRVNLDKGAMALKAVEAVALGAFTPFAALIPVTNTGSGESDDCKRLLVASRMPPIAPPPGQIQHANVEPKTK